MKYFLAIDIGASSGRHIVGKFDGEKTETEEVYRFPNGVTEREGKLVWDIPALFSHVKKGIAAAFSRFPSIASLSVDTWGCDYVLTAGEEEISPCVAYRDRSQDGAIEKVHAVLPFGELYRRTGCQFQPFNTIYRLYADLLAGRLERATDFLMIPEYLIYKLTGVKKKEYTNATTTGLIGAASGAFDTEIVSRLGLPERLFPALCSPGTYVGELLPGIRGECGGNCKVVLCATHDTASAVEGIPMEGNYPYISSGTWSLLGVKTEKPATDERSRQENWSNEGGVGYTRYQKNIMGMWLVNRLREELCPGVPFDKIVSQAGKSRFDGTVDANDPSFLSPASMKGAFDALLGRRLDAPADYFRCAFSSLAESYKKALDEMENNLGKRFEKLYIVGGGAKNGFLNDLTAKKTGKEVIALPMEATSVGNLKIQIQREEN